MTHSKDSEAVLPELPKSFARVCDDGYWVLRQPGKEKFVLIHSCGGGVAQEVYCADQMREYAIAALSARAGAIPSAVTDAMVEAYAEAVNIHLGNMTEKEWRLEKLHPEQSIRRVARIGLAAALAAARAASPAGPVAFLAGDARELMRRAWSLLGVECPNHPLVDELQTYLAATPATDKENGNG